VRTGESGGAHLASADHDQITRRLRLCLSASLDRQRILALAELTFIDRAAGRSAPAARHRQDPSCLPLIWGHQIVVSLPLSACMWRIRILSATFGWQRERAKYSSH
jgi:hypothetical protein